MSASFALEYLPLSRRESNFAESSPTVARTLSDPEPPPGEPVEPLVTALADEIDPQAAACHRDGKPADACQYPRCVDVKSAERIGLASTTRDTRAPRLKPAPSVGIKEDRLLRSASVVTPRQ